MPEHKGIDPDSVTFQLTIGELWNIVQDLGHPTEGVLAEWIWHVLSGTHSGIPADRAALMYEYLGYAPFEGYPLKRISRSLVLKVASVSSNRNSFGLRGMILVAKNGRAFQVAANDVNVKKKGDLLTVIDIKALEGLSAYGFEVPEELKAAPPNVVKEVWGE
jgi:hypothetical protein